jgi:hypothetical protein
MRHREHRVGFGKSFDAFLSIVTKNGLGMLILVAMASTFTNDAVLSEPRFQPVRPERPTRPVLQGDELVLKQPRLKLRMGIPLVKKAAPDAKVLNFECRGERVFPFDFKGIELAYSQFFQAFKDGADMTVKAQQFNAQHLNNEWYNFEFKARCGEPGSPDDPAIYFVPKSKTQGEALGDATKLASLFRRKLQTIDKEKDVVALRVWSDGFEFFRELRAWLQTEGYLIQWTPVETPLFLLHPERYGAGGLVDIDT